MRPNRNSWVLSVQHIATSVLCSTAEHISALVKWLWAQVFLTRYSSVIVGQVPFFKGDEQQLKAPEYMADAKEFYNHVEVDTMQRKCTCYQYTLQSVYQLYSVLEIKSHIAYRAVQLG
jgi:hypothetical protein